MSSRRAIAAGILVSLLSATAIVGCSSDEDRTVEVRADWSSPTTPGTHDLPPSGLSERKRGVLTWTGDRLVVWGGRTPNGDSEPTVALVDGAVFDPSSGRWTPMSKPPFAEALVDPHGARLGSDVLVVGSLCDVEIPPPTEGSPHCPGGPAAAIYHPDTDDWSAIEAPPSAPAMVAIEGDAAAGFISSWVGDDSFGYRYWRDDERWETIDFPESVPASNSYVQTNLSTTADGAHTDLFYVDREPTADAAPTNLRRWSLDSDAAVGWVGPQAVTPQPAMTRATFAILPISRSPNSVLLSVAGGGEGVSLYTLDPAGRLEPLPLPDVSGGSPTIPTNWGPLPSISTEQSRSDSLEPGGPPNGQPSSWLLAEDNSWIPMRDLPPEEYFWGSSTWAGDRLYTTRTVWLPPAGALRT